MNAAQREAGMRARINGVQLGYSDFGQGPVVLFVHDYLLNRQMWQSQVEPLMAAGFRVILADLRGFGESELGEGPADIATYSADLVGLLDFLGVGRAVICGLSFGGSVLFDLMENYPRRIAGACLVNSRAVADDVHERARRGELRAALQHGQSAMVKAELCAMLFAGQGESVPDELRREVRQSLDALQVSALASALQAAGQRKDYTFLLRSLKIPTLLIGAEKDPITHHEHSQLIASQLPNCYRAVKLDGGHLVNMEMAQEFNRYLLDFLAALAPRKQRTRRVPLSRAV